MPNDIQGGANSTPTASPKVAASAASNHQMIVAVLIMLTFIMLCTLVAGESKAAGNAILGLLVIMLVVQGVTKVNPFVSWIARHPLTPQT